MTGNRELNPYNLGIADLVKPIKGLQVDVMLGQDWVAGLQRGLSLDHSMGGDVEGMVVQCSDVRDNLHLVYTLDHRGSLVYGIFDDEGKCLPDPYSCARLKGKENLVESAFRKITGLLEGLIA